MKNLTYRETEILKMIFEEISTIDIALKLKISKRTVDSHRRNILKKSGTSNLLGLYKYAIRNNLVEITNNKK
jgi:DNA-binding CsgD family transcriptional regulator